MPDQAEIDEQQKLLAAHRRTLATLLRQRAMHGIANTPAGIENGILEAREEIRRIKVILREWGVSVEDRPNDDANDDPARDQIEQDRPISQPIPRNSTLVFVTLGGVLTVGILVIGILLYARHPIPSEPQPPSTTLPTSHAPISLPAPSSEPTTPFQTIPTSDVPTANAALAVTPASGDVPTPTRGSKTRYVSPAGNDELKNDCINHDNPCKSIRYAIYRADSHDTISVTGTFSDRLIIDKHLNLVGSDPISTVIDGGGKSIGVAGNTPVIRVSGNITVTISRITIRNGYSLSGGGIYNDSTLTLEDCVVSDNVALHDGGGITNGEHGSLTINRCTISNNTVPITNSGTTPCCAGGISNFGVMKLLNSTISGNSAPDGGGIVTFGILTANNSTISDNTAFMQVGGISISSAPGNRKVTLANTIIAKNVDRSNRWPDCFATQGHLESQGYNLIGVGDDCKFTPILGDKVGTAANPEDPLFGSLRINGGFTPTHALLPGSPAIDAGNPVRPGSSSMACMSSDQRGVERPQRGQCDIGAYESEDK